MAVHLGGGPGVKSHSEIRRADGRIEIVQSKTEAVLQTGDRLYVMTPGGGGYGPPGGRAAPGEPGAVKLLEANLPLVGPGRLETRVYKHTTPSGAGPPRSR